MKFKRINLNKVAREITLQETGKEEVSIAQVKEIMKLMLVWLASLEPLSIFKLLKRYEYK